MKKVLLSSVAALAVFSAVAPVFAEGPAAPSDATPAAIFGPNHKDGETNADTTVAATTEDLAKDANAEKVEDSKAKTGKANNAVVDKDGVLREKGPKKEDKKAPAPEQKAPAAGQKALPKTSAVK